MTKELLIATENRIKAHWEAGDLPYLTHLEGGNEEHLIDYFSRNVDVSNDWVLVSHRAHYKALLFGFTPDELVAEVLAGRSMFLYRERFVQSAIVAGVCSIACGIALAIAQKGAQERVHAFAGDGATDEGSFWEAIRFAHKRDLPLTFIVEDNGGQCGVSSETRWGVDDLEIELSNYAPHVVYYQYDPVYPHAGTLDPDGKPTRPPIKWPIEPKTPVPA